MPKKDKRKKQDVVAEVTDQLGKVAVKLEKAVSKYLKIEEEKAKEANEKTRQYIVRAVGSNVVVGGKTATTTFKRKTRRIGSA